MSVSINEQGIKELFPEVSEIQDPKLRQGVIDIWLDIAAAAPWKRFEDIPKNLAAEKYRPLLSHIRGVTQMALSLAEIAKNLHGTPYDRDLLISACLLHDATKVIESEPDPEGTAAGDAVLPARKSEIGKALPHAALAMHMVLEKGLPVELAHLVITHTHDCNVRGVGWEASILFYADFADTDAGIFPTGEKTYSQRWRPDPE